MITNQDRISCGLFLALCILLTATADARTRLDDRFQSVLWLPGDDMTATDRSSYRQTVTLSGNAAVRIDAAGNAPSFFLDGTNSVAKATSSPSLNWGPDRPLSFACWLKIRASTGANQIVWSKGDTGTGATPSYVLRYMNSNGSFASVISSSLGVTQCQSTFGTYTPGTTGWVHLALSVARNNSCAAGDTIGWVNGIQKTVTVATGTNNNNLDISNSLVLELGARANNGTDGAWCMCNIGDPRWADHIWSQAEVEAMHSEGIGRFK